MAISVALLFVVLVTGSSVALSILYGEQVEQSRIAEREADRANDAANDAREQTRIAKEAERIATEQSRIAKEQFRLAAQESKRATEQSRIAQEEKERAVALAEESAERFEIAWDTFRFVMSKVYTRLHYVGGTSEARLEIMEGLRDRFAELLGSASSLEAGMRVDLANLELSLARLATEHGRFDEAQRHANRSLEIFEELDLEDRTTGFGDDPDLAQGAIALAWALRFQGDLAMRRGELQNAGGWYRRRLAILERSVEEQPDDLEARRGLAHGYVSLSDWAKAAHDIRLERECTDKLYEIRRALAEAEPDSGQNIFELSVAIDRQFRIALQLGELDRAEKLARECLRLRKTLYEADRTNRLSVRGLSAVYEQLALLAERRGQHEESRRWALEMHATKEELVRLEGQNPTYRTDLGIAKARLAQVSRALGALDDAEGYAEDAAEIFDAVLRNEPDYATAQTNLIWCREYLAEAARERGNVEVAAERQGALMRLLAQMARRPNANPRVLVQYALELLEEGPHRDPDLAVEMASLGVERSGGRNPMYLHALAKARFASGDPASALEVAERAMALVPAKRTDLRHELKLAVRAYRAALGSE